MGAQPALGGGGWLELQFLFQWKFQAVFPPAGTGVSPWGLLTPLTPQSHSQGALPPPVPMETAPGLLTSSENHPHLESALWGIGIVNRNEKQFGDRITFVSYLQQN